ncbi:isoaspartyl peptidase/L-asparaginase family protein [Solimonas terrae]|uniref:Isoaspartyl peptidase n=1 Tax=Solimonas terrae TaxID=1396819 RepID=A0A6M2BUJ9_9GAMM|nr:isoaspartyl peptidase/L-asparaginase [Solimonas terrae]NGY06040.1 isoaspartyl peptidase/L-asparaginase [Solimonas terrae]
MIRLAIHGGAGELDAGVDTREQRAELQRIAAAGLRMLRDGASSLDAVEHMVVLLELCPLFNAGVGGVLNRDGRPELDAAIMDGRDRSCGAVAGVCRARSPVRLARAIMERSPHVMFMGVGADELNAELGLDVVEPEYFITELRRRQLRKAQQHNVIVLDHDSAYDGTPPEAGGGFGTVGAVARDVHGHLAAATSTGGLTNKHPGRIGDTPIIGAGTFADNRSAAISCTGTGESFIRVGFGFEVDAQMRYRETSLIKATAHALDAVAMLGGRGGCIAIDARGHIVLPFNSSAMFRAWVDEDGAIGVAVGRD